jgi:rod shape-determining protein MreC
VPERSYTRRDTVLFLACLGLSLIALFLPAQWGQGIGGALRQSVLAPLVLLQVHAQEGKTSLVRLRAVTAQRDSLAYAVQLLPSLRVENDRLRGLLDLSRRVTSPYVAAEVLRQTQATDGRAVLLSVGAREGVAPFDPVIAPEGLIGMVLDVSPSSSMAMTWANGEFRASAFTADGVTSGIVAPSAGGEGVLELRGVPYRDSVPNGMLVLSSGLGGVFPKGIPIGTVEGVVREQAGWERVYRLRPAADPAAVGHVLVLTDPARGNVAEAFVRDTAPPADSIPAAPTDTGSATTAVARDTARRDTARRDTARADTVARPNAARREPDTTRATP